MLFKFLDARAAKALGADLAQIVTSRTPDASEKLAAGRLSKKSQSMLFQLEKKITEFKATGSLNVYTKAQFVNTFKWSLRDKGFDGEYVDTLAAWILQRC